MVCVIRIELMTSTMSTKRFTTELHTLIFTNCVIINIIYNYTNRFMTILNNVILKFLQILFTLFNIIMLGNQAINLFILLICLFGIIQFNIKLVIWKDKILIILKFIFLTILISTFFII